MDPVETKPDKKRSKLAEIFGYDPNELWWYRDLALILVAIPAVSFGLGNLPKIADYDFKLGVGGWLVFGICLLLTPNKAFFLYAITGFNAISYLYAGLVKGEHHLLWIGVPAAIITVKYRNYLFEPK